MGGHGQPCGEVGRGQAPEMSLGSSPHGTHPWGHIPAAGGGSSCPPVPCPGVPSQPQTMSQHGELEQAVPPPSPCWGAARAQPPWVGGWDGDVPLAAPPLTKTHSREPQPAPSLPPEPPHALQGGVRRPPRSSQPHRGGTGRWQGMPTPSCASPRGSMPTAPCWGGVTHTQPLPHSTPVPPVEGQAEPQCPLTAPHQPRMGSYGTPDACPGSGGKPGGIPPKKKSPVQCSHEDACLVIRACLITKLQLL